MPVGSVVSDDSVMRVIGSGTTATASGGIGTTGYAQQAQLHRTQNAGQPVSEPDSVAPTEHGSRTTSAVMPLASVMSTAKIAMKRARRTVSMVYQSGPSS